MADILAFEHYRIERQPRREAGGTGGESGQVLFFTGVRRERMDMASRGGGEDSFARQSETAHPATG